MVTPCHLVSNRSHQEKSYCRNFIFKLWIPNINQLFYSFWYFHRKHEIIILKLTARKRIFIINFAIKIVDILENNMSNSIWLSTMEIVKVFVFLFNVRYLACAMNNFIKFIESLYAICKIFYVIKTGKCMWIAKSINININRCSHCLLIVFFFVTQSSNPRILFDYVN